MDNLRYYEAGRAVPQNAQKQFNNGSFSGTDINPMWRIKKLTEMFGPAGIGWYVEVISERAETYGNTVMAIVDLNLYVKEGGEWSKPIFGTGGNQLVKESKSGLRPSDEGYKMAFTDALSIACKSLGIGADIWYANDVTKYTANSKPQAKPEDKGIPMTSPVAKEEDKPTTDELLELWELIPDEDSRKRTQEMYGEAFENMTRKAYNAILAKCQRIKEAGA